MCVLTWVFTGHQNIYFFHWKSKSIYFFHWKSNLLLFFRSASVYLITFCVILAHIFLPINFFKFFCFDHWQCMRCQIFVRFALFLTQGSYSYRHIKFHTFLIPQNVKFHTKIFIWYYTYCKHSALNRVTKWKYRNIPGGFGETLRLKYSISVNFSKIQLLNFSANWMKNILANKSLAPPEKSPQNSPQSILFHTATLNFILFMTPKNRKLNSIFF